MSLWCQWYHTHAGVCTSLVAIVCSPYHMGLCTGIWARAWVKPTWWLGVLVWKQTSGINELHTIILWEILGQTYNLIKNHNNCNNTQKTGLNPQSQSVQPGTLVVTVRLSSGCSGVEVMVAVLSKAVVLWSSGPPLDPLNGDGGGVPSPQLYKVMWECSVPPLGWGVSQWSVLILWVTGSFWESLMV